MTNREKAVEIAKQNAREYLPQNPGFSMDECNKSALEMAEYKDNILREEREKAIEKFNKYYDQKLNLAIASRYAGVAFFVDKLLGEDSSDKLHCAFVTMD